MKVAVIVRKRIPEEDIGIIKDQWVLVGEMKDNISIWALWWREHNFEPAPEEFVEFCKEKGYEETSYMDILL